MKKLFLLGAFVCLTTLQAYTEPIRKDMRSHIIRDNKPATKWQHAYPVGNGRLGAMPWGDYPNEQILLNEETIWQGRNSMQNSMESMFIIEEIRNLLWAEKYKEAQEMVHNDFLAKEVTPRAYQPLGYLKINYKASDQVSAKNYYRSLSLNDGVAKTEFKTTNGYYIRQEVFASHPDKVIVVSLQSLNHKKLSLEVSMDRYASYTTKIIGNNILAMEGQAMNENIDQNSNSNTFSTGKNRGTRFYGMTKILTDGKLYAEGNVINVEDAKSILLLITSSTDYNYQNPYISLRHDREKACLDIITKAEKYTYSKLLDRHIRDHKPFMERATIDLGITDKSILNKTTAERLELIKKSGNDPDLIEDLFQMGRYMLVASSRKGTLPPNLTGIWNGEPNPVCDADWHTNINVQQNYWHAELTNLSDLHEPFITLLNDIRLDQGKQMAAKLGCRGFVISHATHAWKQSVFSGHPFWGMWPMGAAWCCSHVMEHYNFTNNKKFLRDTAYAILKDNALFCLDWLVENPKTGELVSGPSTSPENGFYVDNYKGVINICMGPTIDHQIIYESFSNFLKASEILGISDELTEEISKARNRIAKTKIAPDGRIMEWDKNYKEWEVNHRHYSHLYALYPGCEINSETPDLFEAAHKSIDMRQDKGGCWQGWSRAWLVNLYARLYEPQKAYSTILHLLKNNTLPNLMHTQPPIFFDGNGASSAGIAELLLQSQDKSGVIHFLPCLPKEWKNGFFSGLCARGAFEISLKWKNGQPTEAQVFSKAGNEFKLKGIKPVKVYSNGTEIITRQANGHTVFDTRKNTNYNIEFI